MTLLALAMPERSPFFSLSPGVKLRPIRSGQSKGNFLKSAGVSLGNLTKLREALMDINPDCLISFLDVNNILSILASRRLQTTVIVSERTNPYGILRLPRRWELLRLLTYPFADGLVVQTKHALSFFSARVRARAWVIPNPVLLPSLEQGFSGKSDQAKPYRTVMGLGSLRDAKGFDRLIEAFSRIASEHSEWHLFIHGEGPCRPRLERQVSRLGLTHRIHLPGITRDSYARLREADLFVLSSRSEGFPNALAEAMACGLPAISFDCHSGPRELIRDGVDGVLVRDGDISGLARQLDRLMGDPTERARLARKAPEVLERFSSQRVLAMWEAAMEDANKRSAGKGRKWVDQLRTWVHV